MDHEFKLLPIFPTTIACVNLKNKSHDLNVQLVLDILKEYEKDPEGRLHSNFGGWHSSPGLEKHYDSFSQLKTIIKKYVDEYCKKAGYSYDFLVCDDLWANINGPGDLNFVHHHGDSALTGVYYPVESLVDNKMNFNYTEELPINPGKIDGKNGGSLVLHNPTYGRNLILHDIQATPHNVNFFHIYPTSGILLLFQSNLLHQVLPFRENKQRVSISFSCTYDYLKHDE